MFLTHHLYRSFVALAMLPIFLALAPACAPVFTDQECRNDFQCFSNEICTDGTCQLRPVVVEVLPVIDRFTVNAVVIDEGETVVLRWKTSHAASVIIEGGSFSFEVPQDALGEGEWSVVPAETTSFTLTATNEFDSVSQSLSIEVIPEVVVELGPPRVDLFEVSATRVDKGATVTVRWKTEFVASGSVGFADQLYVIPANELKSGETDFVINDDVSVGLELVNEKGFVAREIAIVLDRPVISQFAATPEFSISGDPVILSWNVENADSITVLDDDDEPIALSSSDLDGRTTTIHPEKNSTYSLVATNTNGWTERVIEIGVIARLTIASFAVNDETIRIGESIELNWQTSGDATSVAIHDQNNNAIELGATTLPNGSITLTPAQDTTYTLTITNATQTRSESVSVVVLPLDPVISVLTATPSHVVAGTDTTLSWTVSGAESLTLEDALGNSIDISAKSLISDTISIQVDANSSYTLVATNRGGSATRTVDVTTGPVVNIEVFEALTSTEISFGQSVALRWVVEGASSLSLIRAPGGAVNIASKSIIEDTVIVTPSVDTTYVLTANGLEGPQTALVTIMIKRPTVTQFTADSQQIVIGEKVKLSWQTADATSVSILSNQGGGNVDVTNQGVSFGEFEFQPEVNTTYTLRATSSFGSADSSPITVTVLPLPPVIESFFADPAWTATGSDVQLKWKVSGATSLALRDNLNNPISLAGRSVEEDAVTVSVPANRTYTLTASNTGGTDIETTSVEAGELIMSFSADVTTSQAGEAVTLSWQTQYVTDMEILDGDAEPIDFIVTATGSVVVFPQVDTTYTLIVEGPGGPASAHIDIEVTSADLVISELFYSAPAPVDGRQWVEIYNAGQSTVDLSNYSLGNGTSNYAYSKVQLSGTLAPGGCFVVGGPSSDATNHFPDLDQSVQFSPAFAGPGAGAAAGVALFFLPATSIVATSVPIDAVVYGSSNAGGLLGPDGEPVQNLAMGTDEGDSLERTSSGAFAIQSSPTPGDCSHAL
ncbi:MAG: lamin tail domain-containing protein [Bradymonadaceae bacterium]|nr:lamin tail domain-containing protein [Lujinxingiaceae bacterium]